MNSAKNTKIKNAFLIFSLIFFAAYFILIDWQDLPDYESYERIYNNSLLGGDWEIAFILINFLANLYGFTYTEFRSSILIFSLISIGALLIKIEKLNLTNIRSAISSNIFIFCILGVFVFEYFLIRIRAGFAMGIIFASVIVLIGNINFIKIIIAFALAAFAFFTHKSTTVIIYSFMGLSAFTLIMDMRSMINKLIFYFLSFGVTILLLYITNSTFEDRGEHIFSPLNPVRFIMLAVVPLVIFGFLKNRIKNNVINSNSKINFVVYFERFYIILALGLIVIYFAGLATDSGEALVRLYTLTSVPALLALKMSGTIKNAPISSYLLFVNASFFLATIFNPG